MKTDDRKVGSETVESIVDREDMLSDPIAFGLREIGTAQQFFVSAVL